MPSTADLHCSHLRWSTTVILYTNAQTHRFDFCGFVVDLFAQYVDKKSNQWSLNLTGHVCANINLLLAVCVAKCYLISTDACCFSITLGVNRSVCSTI